jgi:peroxiredoxin/predicted 2-oxoglutarate/Fe(II)-dependent dioxygenase YbiX
MFRRPERRAGWTACRASAPQFDILSAPVAVRDKPGQNAVEQTSLIVGAPAPWFKCRSTSAPVYHFDTVAGRHVVLTFFGSAGEPAAARVLADFMAERQIFDDDKAIFFGVSIDPEDEAQERVRASMPGVRHFWDFDRAVSRLYGTARPNGQYARATFILDPALRIVAAIPIRQDGADHAALVLRTLKALISASRAFFSGSAPVLVVPHIFEPDFCRQLVALYEKDGGGDSGHMTQVGDKTIGVIDHSMKRRRDASIDDVELRKACVVRLETRLKPAIARAFQFNATRLERHIVSCYDGTDQGFFRAHRDNTTNATAYRRFAVSLFLNTGEYEGGQLRFPEFGDRLYTAPIGGAVVFSCSLLHEAMPVTRGKRYMYLPFLFDDAAEVQRQECLRNLGEDNSLADDGAGPPVK